jgi:hypothetical protein
MEGLEYTSPYFICQFCQEEFQIIQDRSGAFEGGSLWPLYCQLCSILLRSQTQTTQSSADHPDVRLPLHESQAVSNDVSQPVPDSTVLPQTSSVEGMPTSGPQEAVGPASDDDPDMMPRDVPRDEPQDEPQDDPAVWTLDVPERRPEGPLYCTPDKDTFEPIFATPRPQDTYRTYTWTLVNFPHEPGDSEEDPTNFLAVEMHVLMDCSYQAQHSMA